MDYYRRGRCFFVALLGREEREKVRAGKVKSRKLASLCVRELVRRDKRGNKKELDSRFPPLAGQASRE